MTRNFIAAAIAAIVFSFGPDASAKRSAPADVAAVTRDGVEYRVPMAPDRQGYIDAYDTKTHDLLWSRQIYVVLKEPLLEGDVQDVFINSTKLDGPSLQIRNEKGGEYRLDLESLEVKVVKGAIVVRR